MPDFEWDDFKSLKNWMNHDAWLSEAAFLWLDENLKLTRGKPKDGESRFYAHGIYKKKIWRAVFTLRKGKVRFISFHVARGRQRDAYLGG